MSVDVHVFRRTCLSTYFASSTLIAGSNLRMSDHMVIPAHLHGTHAVACNNVPSCSSLWCPSTGTYELPCLLELSPCLIDSYCLFFILLTLETFISKPALLFNWADSSWQSTQPVQLCTSLSHPTPVQSSPPVVPVTPSSDRYFRLLVLQAITSIIIIYDISTSIDGITTTISSLYNH